MVEYLKRGIMRYLNLLLTLTLLLLVGCSGATQGSDEPGLTSFSATGSQGLTLEFLRDQPPSRIYTSTPLVVVAQIKNMGVTDVSNANIYLTGFDRRIISGISDIPVRVNLEGKSTFNPQGDIDFVEFDANNIQLPQGTQSYSPNLVLTACYEYATIATPIVCVDPNPFDTLQDKSCQAGNINTGGSQGAPIAVTSIEQETTPNSIFFRIHISNVGDGTVFDPTRIANCPGQLQFSELNKITLHNPMVGGTAMNCKPESPIRLVDGKATIFCDVSTSSFGSSAYETPMNLRFTYGYKSSIAQKVEIVNIGG